MDDLSKLKKLGCKDLLDLTLCIPKGYEDSRPSSHLEHGAEAVVEVEILQPCIIHRGKRVRFAHTRAFLPKFGIEAELRIFNPSKYHYAIFAPQESFFVHAKVEQTAGKTLLIQPQKLSQIGLITPRFGSKVLKNATIVELTQRLINEESLRELGIPGTEAREICAIFHPNDEFFTHFKKSGFPERAKEALKFIEIFRYLLHLKTKRHTFEALHRLGNRPDEFIASLPFALTKGQSEAIRAIYEDFASKKAARRVIMGDVGCGKTMVILASAFMAYPHRSVLMSPTTLLAEQLYDEAKKYLPQSMRLALLTHDSSKKEHEIAREAHLLIGTHALLYRDLGEAALVMIDEQHRFGTAQRSTLERALSGTGAKKARAHVLQFSATPIPRTLAMIESSLLDFSFIHDLPFPKDITTRIVSKGEFASLLAHLKEEISKGNQAAIIYPLVEESEHLDYLSLKEGESFWRKNFERVYVTHGKDKEKEAILREFRERGEILLATTVVEVGISLPRLSTIVIVAPERLGLATLHQLRGRVSRTGLKGYCFLYTHHPEMTRLHEFSETLSGFKIAELDLKYRQSGDLLGGERQSGANFVHFDPSSDETIFKKAKAILEGA
ncbi:MAG: ATP-dependent DNA helicase RecG [Wolinella sp.]